MICIIVDNNFLVLAGYGITTACAAYSAKNVYDAWQDNGIDGAFKQLGIEAVTYAAGAVAGKVVFFCGGKMYPTAQAAMSAVFDKTPGLKVALGNVADKLITASEKYGETAFAKGIARVEGGILNAEAKVFSSAGQLKDKALQQVGLNGHDEMCAAARLSKDPVIREILAKKADVEINQTSQAILKDGYYEVNGVKFTEYYYNRLWNNGREAPSLTTKKILQSADSITLDMKKPGFLKYKTANSELMYNPVTKKCETANWELTYNPATKEVWHLQQIE